MAIQSSLPYFPILSFLPFALASYSYPAFTAGVIYIGDGWDPACFGGVAACFDGCADAVAFGQSPIPQAFTYTFASPSTTFEWWGFKSPTAGLAQVCFDGATTGCDTVNFFDSNAVVGADAPVLLYSKTGLMNGIHHLTATNQADSSHGNQFGTISVDHFVIDGGVPIFPSNSFISELQIFAEPSAGQIYNVRADFGDGIAPLLGECDINRVVRSLTLHGLQSF